MQIKFDTHTHSVVCSHAFSTIYENAKYAAEIGMDGFAVTEHAPTMEDAPKIYYFRNLKSLPRDICGQKILVGVELNILDNKGTIDLDDDTLSKLDVVNASIHRTLYRDKELTDHTQGYEAVVTNPHVDIICHSGTPQMPYDYEYIIKLAKKHNKLMEINNHSFFVRQSSIGNCRKIAELCKKHEVGIVVSSDAHYFTRIGNYREALQMLEEIDFPEELVMNTTYDKFADYLKFQRGKEPMSYTIYKKNTL